MNKKRLIWVESSDADGKRYNLLSLRIGTVNIPLTVILYTWVAVLFSLPGIALILILGGNAQAGAFLTLTAAFLWVLTGVVGFISWAVYRVVSVNKEKK